jgi:hypothetical protein
MSTLRIAFIPGLIAGVVSVFTSWLWMGVIFHRYQRETPETWRPEGSRSYIAASLPSWKAPGLVSSGASSIHDSANFILVPPG